MKRLILALALSALVASVPLAYAGGVDIEEWKRQQDVKAQQKQFNQLMDRIEMYAANALSGAPAGALSTGRPVAGQQSKAKRMYCLADCLE